MVKKRFKTEIRQDQIAEAALAIVRSNGIKALNLAVVARKVGLVPSAIYRHYKNKNELVTEVLKIIGMRLNGHFEEVVQQDKRSLEKLQLLHAQHINMISSNNAIPRMIFSEEVIGGMPERRRQLYDIIEKVIGNVMTIVRDGQQEGTIRSDVDPESIAVSFMGMIQPAAIIWSLSEGKFDIVRHSKRAWTLFSDSIKTQEGKNNIGSTTRGTS